MSRKILRNILSPKPAPDFVALQVYCQASVEESEHDVEAGKIYGQLYNLAYAAEQRTKLRLDVLDAYVNAEEIEKTKGDLDDGATGEILLMATILRVMAETTQEHAEDLRADEATLRAEDADGRAGRYRAAYDALLHIFND